MSSHRYQVPPDTSTTTAIAELSMDACERDQRRVAIPLPEIRLVVRFGPAARDGLDVHALGVREKVYRKLIPGGQRTVFARLPMHTYQAVFGVPASDIAGRIVALEDLWGDAATKRLLDQLASAHDAVAVATILQSAIAKRITRANKPGIHAQLAFNAAGRLKSTNVTTVARELDVSERHLRRVFREAAGMSPKTFARLTRFHRALSAARENDETNWANIAATVGYYDQAHLIAEFRAIAGATPRAFLAELRGDVA